MRMTGLKQSSTMPSPLDCAKRALVKLLKVAASTHSLQTKLSRDSSDKDVAKAFRTVSLRAHPDKGGNEAAYQTLTEAYDSWQNLLKDRAGVGRPREAREQERAKTARSCDLVLAVPRKEFRVNSKAVLCTYQSFSADCAVALDVWLRFLNSVDANAKTILQVLRFPMFGFCFSAARAKP